MRKKFVNIGLILLTLAVWGYIVNVVFHPFEEENLITENTQISKQVIKTEEQVNYELTMDYPDPFLMKKLRRKKNLAVKKISNKKRKIISKPAISWPSMVYHGRVKSKSANEEIALVRINGKAYRLKENDEVKDLTVTKIWADSISISNKLSSRILARK